MSNRDKAISIINQIPEYKLVYIVNVLNDIKDMLSDDIEAVKPDEWDLDMIAQAERENDGSTVAFEDLLEKDGLSYADL